MQEKHLLLRKQNNKSNFNKISFNPTYIWDRVAAFVVDLIILMLVGNLITAPIKKDLEQSILLQNDGAMVLKLTVIVLLYMILFVLYHWFGIYFFSKTFGKKIFKIEVKSLWENQKVGFYNSFLRAILQLTSVLMAFIPFLEIFHDSKRRVFHEKSTETYTHSLVRFSQEPKRNEILWARIAYSVVFAYLTIFAYSELQNLKNQYSNMSEYITHPEYLCEDVSIAYDSWTNDEETRLDVALALYNANQINDECLELEAQRAISFEEEQDKAYFAMGLLHMDYQELTGKYEEKICSFDNNGEPCLLIQLMNGLKDENYELSHQIFSKWPTKMAIYTSIIAIRQLYLEKKIALASEKINELWGLKPLKNFLSLYRTLIHYDKENYDKAEEAFLMAYPDLDFQHRKVLSALVCEKEVQKSCQYKISKSCNKLEENIIESDLGEVSDLEFVAYLKYSSCPGIESEDIIQNLSAKVDTPEQVALIAAVRAESSGRYEVEKEFLDQIIQTTNKESEIYLTAQIMRLKRIYSLDDLSENIKEWESLGRYHPHYLSYGLAIFDQLIILKNIDLAQQIGEFLNLNYNEMPQVRVAMSKIDEIKKIIPNKNLNEMNIRSPASTKKGNE